MSEISLQKSMLDVRLSFPMATLKKYRLSYTEGCLSEFIKNVLYCEYENNDIESLKIPITFDIELPKGLYLNMREVDIDLYMSLWTGKSSYYPSLLPENNSKAMAQFSRALCMDEGLYFIKRLIDNFPENV